MMLIEAPAIVGILLLVVHISANAIMRAVFRHPLAGTLELAQYWYMPVVALLGFVAAQHRKQHVSADVLFELLPNGTRKYVLTVGQAVAAIISVGFAWFSFGQAMYQASIGTMAGSSQIPAWPVYFVAPIVFALLTVQFSASAVVALRSDSVEDLAEMEITTIEGEATEPGGEK